MYPEFAKYTDEETEIVKKIMDRFMKRAEEHNLGLPRIDTEMDLSAAHACCPLDLARLLAADDFNFAHDMFGIMCHMDRRTGKLDNCFLPRCTRKGT